MGSDEGRVSRWMYFDGFGFGMDNIPMTSGACHASRSSGTDITTPAKRSSNTLAPISFRLSFLSSVPAFMARLLPSGGGASAHVLSIG